MQPISSFNSNLGTAIGLVGQAGSGKTVLGMRLFPKTAVVVFDFNFQSGKRYLEKLNLLSNIVGFDTVTVDSTTGKPFAPNLWYDRFFKIISEMADSKDVDHIFVDGASGITDAIIAKIVGATTTAQIQIQGGKDSWPKWGTVGVTWRGLVSQLRTTGKKLSVAIHESKNQDASDSIWKYELLIPGQTKDLLPNIMSDIWRTEVVEVNGKHIWQVRTLPDVRHENLKNTYGLPAVLPADDLVKKIQEATKPETTTK